MSLIIKHWRGQYPLWISFWLIALLPIVLLRLVEPHWLPLVPLAKSWAIPSVIAYAAFVALLLFPWQAVGLIRSAYRHFDQFGKSHTLYAVQAAVIAGGIAAASHALYTGQRLTALVDQYEFEANKVVERLGIARSQSVPELLMISGPLVFGSTNDVREFLAATTGIRTVVLNSDGGQIYEGRGLAFLFKEYGLNTHVEISCSSACTTAFIGGAIRTLSASAKLGFHQYGLDANRARQISSIYDTVAEQQKDIALFVEQGVATEFTAKMFEAVSTEMWYPASSQLLDAGVITAVGKPGS
jgi:hypothetical protein